MARRWVLRYLLSHDRLALCNLSIYMAECCGPNAHIDSSPDEENPTAVMCDSCHRSYHLCCMDQKDREQAETAIQDNNDWLCKECNGWRQMGEDVPPQVKHYVVQWHPSEEAAETITNDPTLQGQEHQYQQAKQRRQGEATHQQPTADHKSRFKKWHDQLPNKERQGDYGAQAPSRYNIKLGCPDRHKLQVDVMPINPHVDIHPTGKYEVHIRPVLHRHHNVTYTTELACIYTPDGKCKHQLTVQRAATLWHQFQKCMTQRPKMVRRLQAGTYAEELYKLMVRYTDGADINKEKGTKVKLVNHWATPPGIYRVLQEMAGVTKERYASPLNYNTDMDMYWSVHKRDKLFGALHDTYAYTRTGCSVANPEYEDPEMNKSMATAVHAARTAGNQSYLEFHILPAWTDTNKTAYMTWLEAAPDVCKHVLQIPKKHFRFQTPTAWQWGDQYAEHPKWGVNILVTANQRGYTQHFPYWDTEFMTRFYNRMQQAINEYSWHSSGSVSPLATPTAISSASSLPTTPMWLFTLPMNTLSSQSAMCFTISSSRSLCLCVVWSCGLNMCLRIWHIDVALSVRIFRAPCFIAVSIPTSSALLMVF